MMALEIRKDRTPAVLRRLAKSESNARVSRRMLAIANALSGMDRKTAAEAAGMDRQALRDWVIRYNERGLEGLSDRWGKGRPARLNLEEAAELATIILSGPDPEVDGISAYTLEDLTRITQERFGKSFHPASFLAGRGQTSAAAGAGWCGGLVFHDKLRDACLIAHNKKNQSQPPAERPGRRRGL